ncbi:MAG: WecB/TagA/CpsF family glycosyltransferase [Chloroflexi bacterium]|nr:WecB/TagA/CpsF family glycosyltransferase [Chloroflexota bacterium]MCL5075391.1 WecB/TagA/CpsF family glycosyltransferase [Chloroflexota bacterium]
MSASETCIFSPMNTSRFIEQMKSIEILGVRIDDITYAEAIAIIGDFIRSGQPHQVVTPNPEFIMAARKDGQFKEILNGAALAIPDGGGLLLAARILNQGLREQVRGTDLIYNLAELAAREGYSFFLLGATPGVAEKAALSLQRSYPGLRIAGTYAGAPDPHYDEEIVRIIRGAGLVDILLVAYGAPAQDKWIARNLAKLQVPVVIGVGGVFDYLSGTVKRAPLWMRQAGLEWLYRLIKQPWRWRRQLALPMFILTVLQTRLRSTVHRGAPVSTESQGDQKDGEDKSSARE